MKKLLIAALAATAFTATPAFAQTATGEIVLNATVAKACGVGNHLSGAASAPGWDQADIAVTLADGNGQFAGQTFTNRSFGNVWCNSAANVTLTVVPMTTSNTTTDGASFTSRFDVSIVTDAGVYIGQSQDYVLSSATGPVAGTSASGATGGAFETGLQRFGGADSITVLADPSNRRPVAGTYVGYVRFTATAI